MVVVATVPRRFARPVLLACGRTAKVRPRLRVLRVSGDALVSRLERDKRLRADLFWFWEPVPGWRLAAQGKTLRLPSSAWRRLPEPFRDPGGRWVGLGGRARVFLVNRDLVPAEDVPHSLRDLLDPRWRGRIAMQSPLSGDARLHLAALFALWKKDRGARARSFLRGLRENFVRTVPTEEDVARLVIEGRVAVGLLDSRTARRAARQAQHLEVVFPDQESIGTLVVPTVLLVPKGARRPGAARRLAACLLSRTGERRFVRLSDLVALGAGLPPPKELGGERLRVLRVNLAGLERVWQKWEPVVRDWVRE